MNGFTRHWFPVREAARILSTTPDALRRLLERRAKGSPHAHFDGIRARKFANRWRVSCDEPWLK